MNHKLEDIFGSLEPNLVEADIKKITSSLAIKDRRKNPTPEQEVRLKAICQLIAAGEPIESAISKVITRDYNSPESGTIDRDWEKIILEQANKAADTALLSLPNEARIEAEQLRQTFIRLFRSRIKEQLSSPEFQQQFISQIECLGEQTAFSSSMTNTALLDS